jgi:Sulfotransferase domain
MIPHGRSGGTQGRHRASGEAVNVAHLEVPKVTTTAASVDLGASGGAGAIVSPRVARKGTDLASRAARQIDFAARYATADFRAFPDVVIIGAQRSGTTSLLRWLSARPDVARAWKKEVHYFDNHYPRGLRWYRSHFAFRRAGRMNCESSPYLLLHPLAPARVARDLPDARFIAVLRDPVERAISNHWLRRRNGAAQGESLDEALDREAEILASETQRLLRGEVSLVHMAYAYVARGEYAPQLRRWFEAVGRDRVLVVESERLSTDPSEGARVLRWLGLPDRNEPFPVSNQAVREGEASPEARARLRAHFEPFNQELFELLGYELWTGRPVSASGDED